MSTQEPFERLLERLLERIANAFEEQKRTNLAWIELQKQWHEKSEALTEKRYQEHTDREERAFTRNQVWHDEAERLNEQRYQEQAEHEQALLRAYLASLIREREQHE